MITPAMPNADRLAGAVNAFREIAAAAHELGNQARRQGVPGWDGHAAMAILSEWNDSNDPPEIYTNLDGWHGEIQSQGFRIALTHGNDMARLGLYRGAHDGAHGDALGDPIILEEI